MSFATPAHRITRWSIEGMEGMWAKMFDPPTESPDTPDLVAPTNPVPEVLYAAGLQDRPTTPHTVERDLMHGAVIPTWDGAKELTFFLFRDSDNDATSNGTFPGPTLRIPRGVVFHGHTKGHGPPPHTIHWHGQEPTPMNDGVGHCSTEIGEYTYQWQPNFIGSYFYHCHRNTVQHFEFGLYGFTVIEPPDAYFATQQNPTILIGHCRDGKRRTAANLANFPQFPNFNDNPLTAADPLGQYPTDPHAMTVAYDVEALWVLDDRDSVWSDLASNAKATYPRHGSIPGVDDNFHGNGGGSTATPDQFFSFNDFNADYWFVTGVPVPAHKGETAAIPPNVVIPAVLNSGVSGTQVSINAKLGDTILIRCLDAAYNCLELTFPVDIVITAWDGRALGVPPYGQYNHPYEVPAGTTIHMSTARRFDALIKSDTPVDDFATVKFIDTRGQVPGFPEEVLVTAKIPIRISETPVNPLQTRAGWNLIAGGGGSDTGGRVVFGYDASGYHSEQAAAMEAGHGYWLKTPAATTVTLTTTSLPLTVQLYPGWNLIGNSSSERVLIPSGLVAYAYDGGFVSTTSLEPGQGAWLKSTTEQLVELAPDEG